MLEWTGERYVPWFDGAEIGYEHLHRYAFATQFVRNKSVLDLACGEGYGSNLLAGTAKHVVGIDLDEQTVKHAKNKYIRSNLDFRIGSITEIPINGQRVFDVIVCFEALEHVDDHDRLLSEAKRLLAPGGLFSSPRPTRRFTRTNPISTIRTMCMNSISMSSRPNSTATSSRSRFSVSVFIATPISGRCFPRNARSPASS